MTTHQQKSSAISEPASSWAASGEGTFVALVQRELPRLLALGRRLVGCEFEANDVVQEALVQALAGANTFRARCSMSTWLYRITVNAALTRLRVRRRRRECSLDAPLAEALDEDHSARCSVDLQVDEILAIREDRAHVRACIAQLPDAYRTVLVLRDIEELDTLQVTRLLGITENAVKVRLYRARRALRSLLACRAAASGGARDRLGVELV